MSSDNIGNQTRDLPACSAMPQPNAPQAAWHASNKTTFPVPLGPPPASSEGVRFRKMQRREEFEIWVVRFGSRFCEGLFGGRRDSWHRDTVLTNYYNCVFAFFGLRLILLTWRIGWAPNNASRRQMGFNSAFTGLKCSLTHILLTWRIWWAPYNASRWHIGFNSTFEGLKYTLNFILPKCRIW